ncbi:hypothetical protein, partial [Streptomyces lunaelactis]|uniref:hypothetical protein n=3 Tax=Streptomyces lunaelactis TaxID=1535768 RepID=UPI001C2FDCD8
MPENLSPLRWRWMLLTTRRQEVRFVFWPPRRPTGHRRIRMFDRQGYDIGTLVWIVCDTCRVGSINKISISDPPGACRRARPPLADHRPVPRGEAILPRHGEGDRHRVPAVRARSWNAASETATRRGASSRQGGENVPPRPLQPWKAAAFSPGRIIRAFSGRVRV